VRIRGVTKSPIPPHSFVHKAEMGKRSRKEAGAADEKTDVSNQAEKSLLVDEKAVDPSLALLFASSVSQF